MPTTEMTRGWEQEPPYLQKWVDYKEPDDLKAEIEQASKMLELEDDWDGEGSQTYSRDTFNRAVAFLTRHSEQLKPYGIRLPVPKIGPGPDGSIDLHWKRRSWELLVN